MFGHNARGCLLRSNASCVSCCCKSFWNGCDKLLLAASANRFYVPVCCYLRVAKKASQWLHQGSRMHRSGIRMCYVLLLRQSVDISCRFGCNIDLFIHHSSNHSLHQSTAFAHICCLNQTIIYCMQSVDRTIHFFSLPHSLLHSLNQYSITHILSLTCCFLFGLSLPTSVLSTVTLNLVFPYFPSVIAHFAARCPARCSTLSP
jgi:hypothetical protein